MKAILDDFRIAGPVRTANRVLQVLLSMLLILGINYLGFRHYLRVDLTAGHRHTLAPETIAYIEQVRDNLDQPVRIIVTIPPDSARPDERILYRHARSVLDAFSHASRSAAGQPTVLVEYVDLYRHLTRAAEITRDYGVEQPNLVVFVGPNRQRVLVPTDILEFEDREPTAFKGEQAFTSALVEVSGEAKPTLYFTTGHGEARLDDFDSRRGLSVLVDELRARNIAVLPLDLTQERAIPEDADMVVVADPLGPLSAPAVEALRTYAMERAGRIMLLLGPARRHGLDPLLADWGITTDDAVVLESSSHYLEESGNLLIREFGRHPITEGLIRNQTVVLGGLFRPARPRPDLPADGSLRLTPLASSSASSWGEFLYERRGEPVFDAGLDLPGPVPVATVAERTLSSHLGIHLPGGRLVVFGTGELFSNQLITTVGNHTLFFSMLNWMLDRDRLLAVPPRRIEKFQLPLSRSDLQAMALWMLIPSALAGLLGLLVWAVRRH